MEFNMIIDKIYGKDHQRHIKGHDSTGHESEFDYNGFFPLNDLVEKGDLFSKDSASLFYLLRKKNIVYTFEWECQNGGTLISVDTIKE